MQLVVVVVVVGLNAIFQHMIDYTWLPVLMVEEETLKSAERTTDPRELLASFLT
jgi:hypothetical protein